MGVFIVCFVAKCGALKTKGCDSISYLQNHTDRWCKLSGLALILSQSGAVMPQLLKMQYIRKHTMAFCRITFEMELHLKDYSSVFPAKNTKFSQKHVTLLTDCIIET